MLEPARTVAIFQSSSPVTFVAGEIIFSQGEPGNTIMYGIIEGEIEILVDDKIVETLAAGDVFGEGSLLRPDRLRASSAIAKSDCKLAFLDRERFLFAAQETPLFALEVMKSYSDRLRRLSQRFVTECG
ncbi:MAG: cyclic nucleotide-binding domain-containing protein [Hydrococcus sp. C42_A2020_068]|uniref:cyclic nucleotide-binding domain-containing protein n=1 Tax=Pleurocapsa sp. PCC 7327 TaxID=118163 RepID=UPI00029FA6EB|nr:cyclic nucleotide-binding domain-containing protein [Pleurocapsa sp. PCC 7327]AFY79402.1 cyclic nucleotide-binding protein [Pleurocapsa sp. PCC 7327]MBF2020101.1 cyclic nucleotide-binding domain-containing protein [Hydrococcus sp. C42_A2020_068]